MNEYKYHNNITQEDINNLQLLNIKPKKQNNMHKQKNIEENIQESTPLIIHEKIENTPFTITGDEEQGYFIRLGQYRLTEYYKNLNELKTLDILNWNFIINVICCIIHTDKQMTIQENPLTQKTN